MLFLLSIYKWPVLAGFVVAPALALIGCHLAARDRAMQTLCVGQGATLGVLVGLGILQTIGAGESVLAIGPFLSAGLFSAATYVFSERIVKKHQASKNTYYASFFGSLLALGYLVCALFPSLENHMTQVFFGDLATLSNNEAIVSAIFGVALVVVMSAFWRLISRESFHMAVFGEAYAAARQAQWSSLVFNVIALSALSFAVQFLGFLFTISTLFLPTAIALGVASRGLKQHFIFSAVLASVATVIGFLMSLKFSRLPTVPMIVVVMLVLGGAAIGLAELAKARRKQG